VSVSEESTIDIAVTHDYEKTDAMYTGILKNPMTLGKHVDRESLEDLNWLLLQ
jgi:hypothetical protein